MIPFRCIPGPKSLPIFGTLHEYTLFKKYNMSKLHKTGLKKYQEFGPIVREEIVSGSNIVWIFNPDDIQVLFLNEGKFPSRRSHLALEKYRKDKAWLYNNGGLLPTNGQEWARLRAVAQKPLTGPLLSSHIQAIENATDDFVDMLKENLQVPNMHEELKKYFVEITGLVLFGQRFNAIQRDLKMDSIGGSLIKAAGETNSSILKTDNSFHLWKWFETKDYALIKNSQEVIENVALKYYSDKNFTQNSLVSFYEKSEKLDFKDIITLVSDFLLAGIDTSANTMAYLLYELAKNPKIQHELHSVTENEAKVDEKVLNQFKLGKAVIKENFRVHPISVGFGRILAQPVTLSGFQVPEGTNVVTQNQVSCRLETYCPFKPNEFLPHRYLAPLKYEQKMHPFLSLPFGFGPRMCIGRRLAERSIQMLLFKLSQAFHIRLNDPNEEIDCESLLINQPEKPVKMELQLKSS